MDIEQQIEELITIYQRIWGLQFPSQVQVYYNILNGWAVGHEGNTTYSWYGWEQKRQTLAQLKENLLLFEKRTKL